MDLDKKIEAVLFFKGGAVKITHLAKILNTDLDNIKEGLASLDEQLQNRGLVLLRKNESVMLGTLPALSDLIEGLIKDELNKDIGKAGIETLAIVLYRGPVTKSEIDNVRGVNSQFILRNLLIRGLVEKVPNPNNQRSFLYTSSFELLSFLGVKQLEDLPEYKNYQEEINRFLANQEKNNEK